MNKELPIEDYKHIAEKCTFEFYNRGEDIMQAGDSGVTFYILVKGRVSVLIPNKEKKKPKKLQSTVTDGTFITSAEGGVSAREAQWRKAQLAQAKSMMQDFTADDDAKFLELLRLFEEMRQKEQNNEGIEMGMTFFELLDKWEQGAEFFSDVLGLDDIII